MRKTLKEWRASLDLTQEQIADKTGISRQHYNRIENNPYSANVSTLDRIAVALGITVNDIFFKDKYDK